LRPSRRRPALGRGAVLRASCAAAPPALRHLRPVGAIRGARRRGIARAAAGRQGPHTHHARARPLKTTKPAGSRFRREATLSR
jgi:hypothetical protein